MTYISQRDAILVHAKAAALAANSKWTDVAIGLPRPKGKCARVWYGGEVDPAHLANRVINARLISERIICAAFWPLGEGSIGGYKAADTEMFTFKHELRTRVLGDSQLGGASTDLEMEYAEPDVAVIGGVRFLILEADFISDYTEYTIAP